MFSSSAPESSWYLQPGKNLVIEKEENASEEEKEASAFWKSILKRKGLPLTTPYQYVPSWPKDPDESYCDSLFVKAKQKREAESLSAFSAAFEAEEKNTQKEEDEKEKVPILKTTNSHYVYETCFAFYSDDRKDEKKKQRSINGIVYKDPELMNKKKLLTRETIQAMPRYREALAAKQQEAALKAVYYYC
ncbi:hypothetical protein Tco_0438056 [Tanacetum coccineum]